MKFIYILSLAFVIASCGDGVADLTVDEYIASKNLVTQELDKGVHIVIENPGSDVRPNINSQVIANYSGTLTNGVEFDSGTDVKFQMSGVIEGWRIGLKALGEGGAATMIIPPNVGYGGQATGVIPANSVLVFDVELLEVN